MTRFFLRILNAPAVVLLALVGIGIQTSLFTFWILPYIQPDFLLLLVVWCAFRRGFLEGGILTLIFADIAELHSSVPRGVFLLAYMLIYLAVKTSSRLLVIPDLRSYVWVAAISTVAGKIVVLATLHLLGVPAAQWKHLLLPILPAAAVNAVLAHWIYGWMERFDWITFKNPKAEQMLEEELQLEAHDL